MEWMGMAETGRKTEQIRNGDILRLLYMVVINLTPYQTHQKIWRGISSWDPQKEVHTMA